MFGKCLKCLLFTEHLLQSSLSIFYKHTCKMKDVEYLKWTDAPFSNKCSWLILQLSFTSMQNEFMTFFHDFFSPVYLRWKRSAFPFGFKNNTTRKTCTVSKLLWHNWFVTNITNSDRTVRRYSQINTKATNVLSKKILKTHFLNFVIRQAADRGTSHPTLS